MSRFILPFLLLFFLITSCEEIINEENISNDTIQLLAPTNDTVLATKQKIAFNWEELDGADNYQLQIATPDFVSTTQINLDTLISRTDYTVDSLAAKPYEWRVRGLNSVYETVYTMNALTVEEP